MKTNTVTRIDKKPILAVNAALEKELRPLLDGELDELKKAIKRDGVLDPVKYWHNPKTGKDEIVDGHNRHRIAQELNILYPVQELHFESIAGAMYWMHRNGAGRRDGKADTVRMSELLAIIKAEEK